VRRRRGAARARAEDPYLPLKALSAYAGLSVRTLRSYLIHPVHPLPHYRIGGKVLARRSEFDAWAARFRVQPADARHTVDTIVDAVLADLAS
jgi:lambda repressor-like predicted transcriptional regulator